MATLHSRLRWEAPTGSVHDGPRRYLLMRPDVLMGALVALDEPVRCAVLEAWARSACTQGGASLRAYREHAGSDVQALVTATTEAAADLGWGRWSVDAERDGWRLRVEHSPFVDGWLAAGGGRAAHPVCAPIRGMFSALLRTAGLAAGAVSESRCAAMEAAAASACEFIAGAQLP